MRRFLRMTLWFSLIVIPLLVTAFAEDLDISLDLGEDRRGIPLIKATVVNAEGTAIARRAVDFYFIPDFFPNYGGRLNGNQPVFLGSGRTNVKGQAETRFAPPYSGVLTFEARVVDADTGEEVAGSLELAVERLESPIPEAEPMPLVALWRPLQVTILVIVVALWLFLLILTLSTVFQIHRLGKEVRTDRPLSTRA